MMKWRRIMEWDSEFDAEFQIYAVKNEHIYTTHRNVLSSECMLRIQAMALIAKQYYMIRRSWEKQ